MSLLLGYLRTDRIPLNVLAMEFGSVPPESPATIGRLEIVDSMVCCSAPRRGARSAAVPELEDVTFTETS